MAFVWGRTLVLPPIAGNPSVMSSHFAIGPPHHFGGSLYHTLG
jgi:hypothetical protein